MGRVVRTQQHDDLYARDFYAWTQEQARLLQELRYGDLDIAHLVDEVASMGASEKREIRNRLAVLVAHLLKWKFQPGARSSGWRGTIDEQRSQIGALLDDSPSLQTYPAAVFVGAYLSGRLLASRETGIDLELFPETPSFSVAEALRDDFWPKEPGLLQP